MMRLENVSAGYGDVPVLANISFQVLPGDFIALAGPNGSGKSTLLKVMAGQLEAAGQVLLDGVPVCQMKPRQRAARIAYFPQTRPLPGMDVDTLVGHGRFCHLGFGRVMQEADRRAVREALATVGLSRYARRPVASLSGGERQRAYLAMLIAQDADILLLDEPAAFLDIQHQVEILDLLKALNEQGKTILFAAHDLPGAFSYAGRVLLMQNGSIVCNAPPAEAAECAVLPQLFGGVGLAPQKGALFGYQLTKAPSPNKG